MSFRAGRGIYFCISPPPRTVTVAALFRGRGLDDAQALPLGRTSIPPVYLRFEIQAGDFRGELFRIQIGTVAKHDDRQFVIDGALDVSMKAHRFPVMPSPRVAAIRVEEPAEAIRHRFTLRPVRVRRPFRL